MPAVLNSLAYQKYLSQQASITSSESFNLSILIFISDYSYIHHNTLELFDVLLKIFLTKVRHNLIFAIRSLTY